MGEQIPPRASQEIKDRIPDAVQTIDAPGEAWYAAVDGEYVAPTLERDGEGTWKWCVCVYGAAGGVVCDTRYVSTFEEAVTAAGEIAKGRGLPVLSNVHRNLSPLADL